MPITARWPYQLTAREMLSTIPQATTPVHTSQCPGRPDLTPCCVSNTLARMLEPLGRMFLLICMASGMGCTASPAGMPSCARLCPVPGSQGPTARNEALCLHSARAEVATKQDCPTQIYGIRYGLRGFYSRDAKPMELKASAVEGIHLQGGTVLVCSSPSTRPLLTPDAHRAALPHPERCTQSLETASFRSTCPSQRLDAHRVALLHPVKVYSKAFRLLI